MTDFLTINSVVVEVLTSGARKNKPVKLGVTSPAFAGNLRSTQRGTRDSWEFTSVPLSLADIATLVAAAPDGSFVSCGGAALGASPVTCQVNYGDMVYEEDGLDFKQTVALSLLAVAPS